MDDFDLTILVPSIDRINWYVKFLAPLGASCHNLETWLWATPMESEFPAQGMFFYKQDASPKREWFYYVLKHWQCFYGSIGSSWHNIQNEAAFKR